MNAGRELDALAHEKVFDVKTELRACWLDPDGGGWEEIQSNDETDEFFTPEVREANLAETIRRAKENHDSGIRYGMQPCYQDKNGQWQVVPFYSTNITDAWQFVEKAQSFNLDYVAILTTVAWKCDFIFPNGNPASVTADTAPLAISLAALNACAVDLG